MNCSALPRHRLVTRRIECTGASLFVDEESGNICKRRWSIPIEVVDQKTLAAIRQWSARLGRWTSQIAGASRGGASHSLDGELA
jgi:hypothetical protein